MWSWIIYSGVSKDLLRTIHSVFPLKVSVLPISFPFIAFVVIAVCTVVCRVHRLMVLGITTLGCAGDCDL